MGSRKPQKNHENDGQEKFQTRVQRSYSRMTRGSVYLRICVDNIDSIYTIDRELIFYSIVTINQQYYLTVNPLNSGVAVGLEVDPEAVPAAVHDDEIDDEHDPLVHQNWIQIATVNMFLNLSQAHIFRHHGYVVNKLR